MDEARGCNPRISRFESYCRLQGKQMKVTNENFPVTVGLPAMILSKGAIVLVGLTLLFSTGCSCLKGFVRPIWNETPEMSRALDEYAIEKCLRQ